MSKRDSLTNVCIYFPSSIDFCITRLNGGVGIKLSWLGFDEDEAIFELIPDFSLLYPNRMLKSLLSTQ